MKVLTIGSGDMYSINNSASYLINDNILLDIPNGTCRELRRLNIEPNSINHVILTHLHADHFFDLPFYLFSRSYSNSTIYCMKEDNDILLNLIDISFPNARSYVSAIFNNDDCFIIDDLKIIRKKVNHGDINSYGYVISDTHTTIGFTGDSSLCDGVEEMASLCDTLICDCTLVEGNEYHMGIDNLIYLSNKYACCIYASHIKDETRKYVDNNNFEALRDGKVLIR